MISLSPTDLALASSLVALDAGVSIALRLNLHRQLLWAAARMVVQLIAVGFILRVIFTLNSPLATLAIVVVMGMIAAREIAARPVHKFKGLAGPAISGYTASAATYGQETRTCTTTGSAACTISGLTSGVEYYVWVTATNAAGTSPPSATTTATPN